MTHCSQKRNWKHSCHIFLILSLFSFVLFSGTISSSANVSLLQNIKASIEVRASSEVANPQLPNTFVSSACTGQNNAEAQEAVDPVTGYIYVVWIGCNGIGFARSIDGNLTFQNAFTVPGSAYPRFSWDPSIAVSQNGVVYIAYMMTSRSMYPNGGIPVVAASFDHGATFSQPSNVSLSSPSEFSDRDFIAVSSNGTIYITWDYSPDGSLDTFLCAPGGSCYFTTGDYNIVISHSSDGGKTWSSATPVNPEYPNGGAVAAPLIAEPNGQIDVLYEDYNTTSSNVLERGFNYFTTSTDGGKSWSQRISVGAAQNLGLSPTEWWIDGTISQDSSGTLYASWDSPNSTSDNAWISFSQNDGENWSMPIQVNPNEQNSSHIMASVVGVGSGTAYVAWMSNDTSGGWSTYFREFSISRDFVTPPVLVSGLLGIKGIWGGDTIGLTALNNGRVAIAWGYGVKTLQGDNVINSSEIYGADFAPFSNVTFSETGLQNGSSWGVTLNGTTVMTTSASVAFSDVLVGNYSLSVSGSPKSGYSFSGWSSNSSDITFGNPKSESTTITLSGPSSIIARFGGSPVPFYLYVTVATAAIVILSLVAFYSRRRSFVKSQKEKSRAAYGSDGIKSLQSITDVLRYA
jgi:Divergent InlB B-repeat domain